MKKTFKALLLLLLALSASTLSSCMSSSPEPQTEYEKEKHSRFETAENALYPLTDLVKAAIGFAYRAQFQKDPIWFDLDITIPVNELKGLRCYGKTEKK